MNSERAAIAYVPVIHDGYLAFFERAAPPLRLPVTEVGLLGDWIFDIEALAYFKKDIRRMDAFNVLAALHPLLPGALRIRVLASPEQFLECQPAEVVMPDDHVTRVLQEKYPEWFKRRALTLDTPFLIWDKMSTKKQYEAEPDRTIRLTDAEGRWMMRAQEEKRKSSDWYRQVGAVAVRDGVELIAAHNEHFPTEHAPYEDGDPRSSFHRGGDLDKTTAGHAETLIIARGHRSFIRISDADLFVTTFSCPPCAISIAESGIRRLYYADGYSMISAAPILKSRGVEIVRVI